MAERTRGPYAMALNPFHGRSLALGRRLGSTALRYSWPDSRAHSKVWHLVCDSVPHENLPQEEDSTDSRIARLEAILFLANEPLSTRKLAKLAKLADGTQARTLLKELTIRLDRRSSAFQVVEVANGVQLLTRPQLADWLRRLNGSSSEMRLSAPALESLSVVAYRQPIPRAEIEAIRGVQCGEVLKVLMERDLLRIVGRSEELGRPFLYGTTKKFLQVFGLRRLEELPPIDQIHSFVS